MMYKEDVYVKEKKGKTLFAKRAFKRGEFIFLIEGPITKKPTRYTVPISEDLLIDPVPLNNLARYLCHSCEPNAGIKNRTMVVAFNNIKKDEEICIDYAMIVDKFRNEIPKKIWFTCNCGSKNCRGELGSWFKLPEKLKKKYKGFVSDYILKLR